MRPRATRGAVAVVLTALTLTALPGCSPQVTGPSLVLRLATPDSEAQESAPAVRRFAAEVGRLSDQSIRIEPVWQAEGSPAGGVAASVADGTYDLGYESSRALDLLGVHSLEVLNTPFLITSTAALAAVLGSGLRDDLMAGLDVAGLVGLDVHPEGLRHPFGYDAPLLTPADYVGAEIRTAPASETVTALFEALGATVTDEPAGAGTQSGEESQFTRAKGTWATGNVTFFPKANVLMAGNSVRERLREDQWDVLVQAADVTRDWLLAGLPSEFEAAATFCQDAEGRIVAAREEDVEALEAAAGSVTEALREDPQTRRMMDEVSELVAGVMPAEPVTACPWSGSGSDPTELDGIYRFRVRARDLRAVGASPDDVSENHGRFTMTLDGGRWTWRTDRRRVMPDNPTTYGAYSWEAGVLTFFWGDGTGSTRMRVEVLPDGSIGFSDVREELPEKQALADVTFREPWRRVGDVPD